MRSFWLLSLASLAFSKPSCRCLYGEPCWPSSDLPTLASQLSQPLLQPSPPESACYPASNPSGNCTDAVANANDGRWRSDQPGAMQATNFETFMFWNGTIDACYLNSTMGFPCGQGSIPFVGVDARSVEDVQATVKFASNHNLRLVVKNTGYVTLFRPRFSTKLSASQSRLPWSKHSSWKLLVVDAQSQEYHIQRLICS